MPTATSGWPRIARPIAPNRRSSESANSLPPPRARPSSWAIVTCGSVRHRSMNTWMNSSCSGRSVRSRGSAWMSPRSACAMKNSGSALRTTTAPTSPSSASSPASSESEPMSTASNRLTGGWSRVTNATPWSTSTRRPSCSYAHGPPPRSGTRRTVPSLAGGARTAAGTTFSSEPFGVGSTYWSVGPAEGPALSATPAGRVAGGSMEHAITRDSSERVNVRSSIPFFLLQLLPLLAVRHRRDDDGPRPAGGHVLRPDVLHHRRVPPVLLPPQLQARARRSS